MFRAFPDTPALSLAPPATRSAAARFRTLHLWVPLGSALLAIAWLQSGLDRQLADALVRLEGGTWAWRHAPWLEAGLHRTGRALSIGAWLALAAAGVATLRGPRTPLRSAIGYVLASVALGTLAVSALKAVTAVDCPWDLLRYGGTRPWHGLLDVHPGAWPRGRCFPAGHASAGYAWLALYFAAMERAPRLRRLALATALGTGLLFGLSQQLRGAHFASHDVASALVCWLVALGVWAAWPWHRAATAQGGGA